MGGGVTTHDAGSGGLSGLEDPVPEAPRAAEPALDAYGLPVQQRRTPGWTYLLALAAPICGIVSLGLAGMAESAHGKLAGYQIALGILCSWLAMLLPMVVLSKRITKDGRIKGAVSVGIALTGSILGLLGFILLAHAVWHWSGGGA